MTVSLLHVLDVRPDGSHREVVTRSVSPGQTLDIGREGADLGIAVDPVDPMVSRHAVRVTATDRGWHVADSNANGTHVQYWGQPWLPYRRVDEHSWPRIALHVLGDETQRHLVLLERPELAIASPPAPHTDRLTQSAPRPTPLTERQTDALRAVFGELLDWPPHPRPQQRQLKQAARLLGIGVEAVQRRLEHSRDKAYALGLSRVVPLTDPEYLFVLVRAGYLAPSESDVQPVLR